MRNFFNYLDRYCNGIRYDDELLPKAVMRQKLDISGVCEAAQKFVEGTNVWYERISTGNGFDYRATLMDNGTYSLREFEKEIRSVVDKVLSEMKLVAETYVTRERCGKSTELQVRIHIK